MEEERVAISRSTTGSSCPSCGAEKRLSYEDLKSVADHIRSLTDIRPLVGIICGSGLGKLGEDLDKDKAFNVVPYSEIPGFPQATVHGHKGNLVFGYISGKPVVCMQGRFHFYEGHPPWKSTMPVRVMKLLGIHTLIVTNASGGINPLFSVGDVMVMVDHLNLCGMAGFNPLIGENHDNFGPRFPAMTEPYDIGLQKLTKEVAHELGMESFLQEGVYCHLAGPSYETPAEIRFLRKVGCDTVGMSTAPEVVVAKHCGLKVLGLSLVTNVAISDNTISHLKPCHKEVMDVADKRAADMQKLVKVVVGRLSSPV